MTDTVVKNLKAITNNLVARTKPKVSKEDSEAMNQKRKTLTIMLEDAKKAVKDDEDNETLFPETVRALYSLIQEFDTWLTTNPYAAVPELDAKQQEFEKQFKQTKELSETYNGFAFAAGKLSIAYLDNFIANKYVTESDIAYLRPKLTKVATIFLERPDEEFMSKLERAGKVMPREEIQKALQLLEKKVPPAVMKDAQTSFSSLKYKDLRDKVKSLGGKTAITIQSDVSVSQGVSIVADTAAKVFVGLLSFVLCLLAGSFAANFAMGRDAKYRILYFIFGALPQFAVFVLLYVILQRFRLGPGKIPWYALLPLTTTPATSRLGAIFLWPFLYSPDAGVAVLKEEFERSLRV